MIDERLEQDAALFALDLLEGEERAAFEAALARDPALRRLVDELRSASTQLAHAADAPAPPPALRARILASIATAAPETPAAGSAIPFPTAAPSAVAPDRPGGLTLFRWLAPGLAAALALGVFFYGFRYHRTAEELALARDRLDATRARAVGLQARLDFERRRSEARLAELQAELRRLGTLEQVSLARLARTDARYPDAQALALWDPRSRRGLLTLENLPAPGPDEDYQLWAIIPGEPAPVSLGVFLVQPSGVSRISFSLDRPLDPATGLAISREPKGGSATPRGPVIAAGAL